MNRFALLAAFVAAAISFGAAAVASGQESPTPQPAGTTTPNLCAGTPQRGGETIAVGSNTITPPGGASIVIQPAPPQARGFTVCYVEGNARVTIASSTCDEVGRENPDDDPGADFVLDLIVDSCERFAPTATATQPSQGDDDDDVVAATPTATNGTISPPSTGDAGLK